MGSRKTRKPTDLAKLEMTPMIDVVFQLLIFFIVTLSEQDILSHLAISRPQPDRPQNRPDISLLTIQVSKDGWTLNGRSITGPQAEEQLSRQIARLASFNPGISVVIQCTNDAPHGKLIQTLNICAREKMPNISVFSL